VLATVHQRAHPVTDAIKARSDVELVTAGMGCQRR